MSASEKTKVLLFVDWFVPGFRAGGPIRSAANIVETLKDEIDFSVVTSDTDFGMDTPYPDVPADEWVQRTGYRVMYLNQQSWSKAKVRQLIKDTPWDALYFNSLFSFRYTLYPLYCAKRLRKGRRIILAPRGMTGKGALKIKSGKKQVFLQLAKLMGLYNNITWHASSPIEAKDIQAVFGQRIDVKVALNLPSFHPLEQPRKSKQQPARFLFLSRISSIKGLHNAIEWFDGVKSPQQPVFDIAGPADEQAYLDRCKALAATMEKAVQINFVGPVPYEQITAVLDKHDFLLMPTEHENYGHIIVEAMARGLPVIISDRTPWKGLANAQVGWDLPLEDPSQWTATLQQAVDMPEATYLEWSENAVKFASTKAMNEEVLTQNRAIFGS